MGGPDTSQVLSLALCGCVFQGWLCLTLRGVCCNADLATLLLCTLQTYTYEVKPLTGAELTHKVRGCGHQVCRTCKQHKTWIRQACGPHLGPCRRQIMLGIVC
jgi:hypothetical protein